MKNPRNVRSGALAAASILLAASSAHAQTFFSDSLDSSAGWTVNAFGAGDLATFGFDYSTVGIPASPNSGGTTLGLMLQANRPGSGVFSGISVSPTGQSFTGDYILRFDLWQNFPGPFPGGGAGSTQLSGAGIMTAGTTPQWAGATYDSIFFMATGDGGSGADYRVYPRANNAGVASGFYAAGTGSTAQNNTDPYYATFGGVTAPAAQLALHSQQTGSTMAGTQGMAWHDVAITKAGNVVTWQIDGKLIATVDVSAITGFGGDNILLNHSDINAGVTDAGGEPLLFGLFDNVRVTAVPEPSTYALMGLAGAFLMARSRRQKR